MNYISVGGVSGFHAGEQRGDELCVFVAALGSDADMGFVDAAFVCPIHDLSRLRGEVAVADE